MSLDQQWHFKRKKFYLKSMIVISKLFQTKLEDEEPVWGEL